MKKPTALLRVLRRGEALVLAVGTLWTVSVTAGSATAVSALRSLKEALWLQTLRWELGDIWPQDHLSGAAALTLAQSPVLRAARASVAELWFTEEPQPVSPAPSEEETISRPVEETPVTSAAADNGVAAKTLVPTDPSGYTVCGRVYISNATEHSLTMEALRQPFAASLTAEEPQILILHTHGSEAYTPAEAGEIVWSGDHRTTDSRYNVVMAGDRMAEVFAAAGISVLHDRTLYDYPSYSGAYDRALSAIEDALARYPSIRFVLDVHRDAIVDGGGREYKVVSKVDGGTAAQLSLVMGSDGSGAHHPHWMENLRLAVAIQERALQAYPTLMRPVLLRNSRYNQHATTGSLLVEVGAAGNSPEEAALAAELFAESMVQTLKESGETS